MNVQRRFDASPERVFDAWMSCRPGEYLEADRPRRLVFPARAGRVTVEIAPEGAGCTLTVSGQGDENWLEILDRVEREVQFGVAVEPGTVRLERLLPGPIERVWSYLTDSEKRGLWFAAGPMEPRAGGKVELRFRHDTLASKTAPRPERFRGQKTDHEAVETVTRFEPPRLLSFTFGGGSADVPSEVTFELTPYGDKVRLVLTHRRLASRDSMKGVSEGWHAHLTVLVERLNGREPEAFWDIFMRIDGEYESRIPA